MSLVHFHPVVARWFEQTLGEPTPAQSRGWAAVRERRHTLIAAPTGSGKTLAAFLTALNDLVEEGLRSPLPDEVRVVYVSPLKALSADIHKNLAEPRRGIQCVAGELGLDAPRITAAVRSGDTTPAERAAMARKPPHILVTTPESLYLLLTAARSREILRTARTVIVDEIHAIIGTRRGAHLALSLERLQEVAASPLVRLGLSATQKPIDEVARFLGAGDGVHVVDEGHRRNIDLDLEIPRSPLEAVMSQEVWDEYYNRLTELIHSHRTTLVFVNTRRMAERVARQLSDRLGDETVTAHHGSLSKEKRLDAEGRLKSGRLKALVATASLELGIDIGHVDLVCQIGSPHRIATLLQRVGRSGHTVTGTPKGRLFPVSRDDLVECVALLRMVARGELDAIIAHEAPLDVLAQQIVAESSCREYSEDELFALVRRAWPYRALPRGSFDDVVKMVSEGFSTRRGRRGALVHRDEVHTRLRGRRGARLLAITSGGAIPEIADYRVVLDPEDLFIGTLNEDFAIESMAGDVFQLGNASWRILQIGAGVVRVADAKGAPPNIPFWLGEAPARSDELSRAVSELRADVGRGLEPQTNTDEYKPQKNTEEHRPQENTEEHRPQTNTEEHKPQKNTEEHRPRTNTEEHKPQKNTDQHRPRTNTDEHRGVVGWLLSEVGIGVDAAEQVIAYLAESRRTLGVVPTQDTLVLERFFDESGGMQLVLHAPFGSRINKAWGLSLRKRFCRQFNFELQAAATEDALLLSLGPQHSFPLADVFRYLHPSTTRDVLVQALLDAPVFQTRWRWNTTVSLAVPRNRNGRRVPPQLQRMLADDLLSAVFPDASACLENIPGDREIPDHPLVSQTLRDCLTEAMDLDGLLGILERIQCGDVRCVTRDTPEPSLLSHEILNARPYAFLDDAPLEERRTQAVQTRRGGAPVLARDLGALDLGAVDRVRDEQRPDPRDADELHDVLLTVGFLTAGEADALPADLFGELTEWQRAGRATLPARAIETEAGVLEPHGSSPPSRDARLESGGSGHGSSVPDPVSPVVWVAAERLPELGAIHPALVIEPALTAPPSRLAKTWTREAAIIELLRGRLTVVGPTTAAELAASLRIAETDAEAALLALESEGAVLRGAFTTVGLSGRAVEWCDRRLLARIHAYTLNRLRSEIQPVSPAEFMRFLFVWQHIHPGNRLTGLEGLRTVISRLEGFELAAKAWERSVLPARLDRYDPSMLDVLSLTGEVGWARLSHLQTRVAGGTPIALFLRAHEHAWLTLRDPAQSLFGESGLREPARRVLDSLRLRGASFLHELAAACSLTDADVRQALGELVAGGLVASDGFAGLRDIVRAAPGGRLAPSRRGYSAGRWSVLNSGEALMTDEAIEMQAWALLCRYGVVFRRLLTREATSAPWRALTRVYRRLELRGEIRGGRFVSGMSGEQFALPDAVDRLREVRRSSRDGVLLVVSAADPTNLTGIVTAGDRVKAVASALIVYRDGVPLAAIEGGEVRQFAELDTETISQLTSILTRRRLPVSVVRRVSHGV
jgi:ATP-dependent Lhr-like helicase